MCGIVGLFSYRPVAERLYESLIHLQHRGQDAAGILTCHQRFDLKSGLGLVREIFTKENISALKGSLGIAHTRYPTAGGNSLAEVQPLWVGSPRGIALAHNGNLTNYKELAAELTLEQHHHIHSSSDSEVLLHLLAEAFDSTTAPDDDQFFSMLIRCVQSIFDKAQGSFSVVSIISGKGLIAFRDPHGIRPLVWGERLNEDHKKEYIIASEPTMFYPLGFENKGDIQNGELVYINLQGKLFRHTIAQKPFTPCAFEYVYFARPDATLDDVNVYRARLRMGENLAKRWTEKFPHLRPDIVIPVPFTANTAALAFAQALNIPYSEGLYKNPFIGRTFIMAEGKTRDQQVRYKLTPQRFEIKNKKVLLVDDSIVRGTTSREIVKMVREFEAKEVYFASACPPIAHPCFYGIDIPTKKNLIAASHTEKQIREYLNVDYLIYQKLDDLVEAITRRGKHKLTLPCLACMNGEYISPPCHIKTACSKKHPQVAEVL